MVALKCQILLVLCLLGICFFSCPEENRPPVDKQAETLVGFDVACFPSEPEAGEPVYLITTITNSTHSTISAAECVDNRDFDISATYENGKAVPTTVFWQNLKYGTGPNVNGRVFSRADGSDRNIPVGTTLTEAIRVSQRLDMTAHGIYTITISRLVVVDKKQVVLSKKITVELGRPKERSRLKSSNTAALEGILIAPPQVKAKPQGDTADELATQPVKKDDKTPAKAGTTDQPSPAVATQETPREEKPGTENTPPK